MDQNWFEMRDIRRRPVSGMVWIPLRSSVAISEQGKYGFPGFSKEFFGLGSLAVPLSQRSEAERLSWSDIGLSHEQRSYAFRESYKPADIYQYHDETDLGLELMLEQHFSGAVPTEWHLNQDFVIALGLCREGDSWLCPDEAFINVVRLKRDGQGRPVSIEVRAEFLRDYLAARHMVLRLTWYRQRIATSTDASFITWPDGRLTENTAEGRFEGRCTRAGEGGDPLGAGVAVFRVWRTDVDDGADVPTFGPESDQNTAHESHSFTRESERTVFMIEGEVWRDEWIEPASHSVRIRGDDIPPSAFFVTDAAGTRESRLTLNSEDIGKYLWFRGGVVPRLLEYRGSDLTWYTANTGGIQLTPGYPVHFGMNGLGLVNAYAYDIAKLPDWQQQIWAGYNVTPEGGVSEELLAAQMRSRPAPTHSPEELFVRALNELDESFASKHGKPLLREHRSSAQILRSIHRFRATDNAGLLALAKDVARLTADSIDTVELHSVVPPPKGEKWGSLKSLEKVLASLDPNGDARKLMSPLVGVYELRLGDAHLPSEKIDEAFDLVGIDRTRPTIIQGAQLLMAAGWSLHTAAETIADS